MNKIAYLITILIANTLVAQKTCDTPQEQAIEDLNSITKCSINSSKNPKDKKSRQISVKVSASKKRYLKKRAVEQKSAASSANNLSTSGLSGTNHSLEISNSLTLQKENNNNIIANLTNSLSAEEVKKANRFSTVDKIPSFNECEKTKNNKSLDCFNTAMVKHIQEHFRYPDEAIANKTQGDVWVRFIIDVNGNVSNIKALGPDNTETLEQEAIRVVSKLPRFLPGKKEGKKTSVKYGFPISFSLED